MEKKKVGFASGIGFILAAAGSAVGLGNLWGFPYKTSQNGGAAFVLIYVACVLLIGFVTMLSEIYLGRRAQANPMTAYKMIHKNLGWCGLVAIVIPAFIICYYSVLGGWTTKYALNSFSGNAGIVGTFSVNTGEVILYTAIFLVLSMMIIMGGVKDGIEKASKVLMPVLFLILVAIAVYALTLGSGVREGLSFYLKPDFSGITFKSVLVAMGQAFYSLSLGMGIMITYGSYTGKEVNLVRSTAMICIFDTLVALIAGLAIFPSVAHFDPALLGSSKGVVHLLLALCDDVHDRPVQELAQQQKQDQNVDDRPQKVQIQCQHSSCLRYQPRNRMISSATTKPKIAVPSARAAPSSRLVWILPEASGWREIASVALPVAMPMPMPPPIPVSAAMPAPRAISPFIILISF